MGKSFCYLKGSIVDCSNGTVQDCNTKRVRTCRLDEESAQQNTENTEKAFCFCRGEIVSCLPGVVLDCNNKRTRKCPLIKEEEDEAEQETKAFEQAVQAHKAHKERKGNRVLKAKELKTEHLFCFCRGELVDCSPATVQDCNLKKTKTCKLREQG